MHFLSHLSHLSRQQMDVEVWTVGTQRWVIVIAELQAEGCVVVMKCYDGEGWYSWPAWICITAEQNLHSESSLKNTHFSRSPRLLLPLSRSLILSHADTLSWRLSKTLHAHMLKDTLALPLAVSAYSEYGRGGVYPGLAPGAADR